MDETLKNISQILGYIVAIGTALGVIYGWIAKPLKDIKKENEKQSEQLNNLDADTADLLCSQLTREHDYYIRRGWCSASDKQRLQGIYDRYRRRGRNHVAEHYMDEVIALREYERVVLPSEE